MAAAELHNYFEIQETALYLHSRCFSKVCLQFSDDLLHSSKEVTAELQLACEALRSHSLCPSASDGVSSSMPCLALRDGEKVVEAAYVITPGGVASSHSCDQKAMVKKDSKFFCQGHAQGTELSNQGQGDTLPPLPSFFVLADTTYGSCCVDEVAAGHVAADCVIHYGNACVSQTSRLPARFVFGKAPLDVSDCASQLLTLSSTLRQPVLVLYGLEYAHAMADVAARWTTLQCEQGLRGAAADAMCAGSKSLEEAQCKTVPGEARVSLGGLEDQPAEVRGLERTTPGSSKRQEAAGSDGLVYPMLVLARSRGVEMEPAEALPRRQEAADVANAGLVRDRSQPACCRSGTCADADSAKLSSDVSACCQSDRAVLLGDAGGGCMAKDLTGGHGEEEAFASEAAGGLEAGIVPASTSGDGSSLFVSGGLEWELPPGMCMEEVVVAWVGDEGAPLTNLMLCHNTCKFVHYQPLAKCLVQDLEGQSKALKRRYYLVERAKDANIVGIVVGTLGVGGYRSAIQGVRDLVARAGKKSYTFVMGKPNPAKLANFPECDVFVLVACPQTALLDSREYLAPVLTPFEARLAFARGQTWTGAYSLGFGMVSSSTRATTGHGVEDLVGEGPAEDEEEEEEEPRFSLISGGYMSSARARKETAASGGEGSDSSALLATSDSRTLAVTGKGVVPEVQSAAEYLRLRRGFQGLSMEPPKAEDGSISREPVGTAIVQGRVGRASAYAGEG